MDARYSRGDYWVCFFSLRTFTNVVTFFFLLFLVTASLGHSRRNGCKVSRGGTFFAGFSLRTFTNVLILFFFFRYGFPGPFKTKWTQGIAGGNFYIIFSLRTFTNVVTFFFLFFFLGTASLDHS